MSTLTRQSDGGLQDIAVQAYSTLLGNKKARALFWKDRSNTVAPLIEILKSAAGVANGDASTLWSGAASVRSAETSNSGGVALQSLYYVLLSLWELTFDGAIIGEEFNE